MAMLEISRVSWHEKGATRTARWLSQRTGPAPKQVVVADDRITADHAYRLACEGTAMLWRGDFQNARQLLVALARRIDEPRKGRKRTVAETDALPPMVSLPLSADVFHRYRLARSQRARTLGMLLLPFDKAFAIPLRRAPDVAQACLEAYGEVNELCVASLRELMGIIGAHEWRTRGIEISALGARIYPHYGVFAPVRSEYVDLVAKAVFPISLRSASSPRAAFDIGTGTGVLAAVLAKRGAPRVVATECDARALACANDNMARLELNDRVQVEQANLFPAGRAALIVCNPPWIPARPVSALERAIYDPEGGMLRAFLHDLNAHLDADGEAWLLLSDLAEHLGLRTRSELLALIDSAGLKVIDRIETRPHHPRVADRSDPLHAARHAEVTSLWRLSAR